MFIPLVYLSDDGLEVWGLFSSYNLLLLDVTICFYSFSLSSNGVRISGTLAFFNNYYLSLLFTSLFAFREMVIGFSS